MDHNVIAYIEAKTEAQFVYDEFCISKKCSSFYHWTSDYGNCTSCEKLGKTYVVIAYPKDCPFKEEIKKHKMFAIIKGTNIVK